MMKNLPAMWENHVQLLSQEDPLGREWLPTPVFLPGEFHGQRSLVGYSPWGRKESDTTEQLTLSLFSEGFLDRAFGKVSLGRWHSSRDLDEVRKYKEAPCRKRANARS